MTASGKEVRETRIVTRRLREVRDSFTYEAARADGAYTVWERVLKANDPA